MALAPVGLINEDADLCPFVEGVVVVDVDTADGPPCAVEVNHQAELLLRGQVIVVQQELLDVKQRVGGNGSAHAPYRTVILPAVN